MNCMIQEEQFTTRDGDSGHMNRATNTTPSNNSPHNNSKCVRLYQGSLKPEMGRGNII